MRKTILNRLTTIIAVILVFSVVLVCLCSCKQKEDPTDQIGSDNYQINTKLDLTNPVTLTIVGKSIESWPALENVINAFEKIYTNCTVTYEFIQGDNEVLQRRLDNADDKVDIFVSVGLQSGGELTGYAYDLLGGEYKLDISKTHAGLVDNFRYYSDPTKLYSIPYGGEMRGLYVNTSLLSSLNLSVPKNRSELLNCCSVLKAAGYIPFQSACSDFAQQFLYPSVCNKIAHSSENFDKIEAIDDGVSELLRNEYSFLYDIVSAGYFDYKAVQNIYGYEFLGDPGKARDFLNIEEVSTGVYEKQEGLGNIAFMTSTQAFAKNLAQTKEDYGSTIEYEFILAPTGADGGYAYLSPSSGLAVNKSSDHLDWSVEFLNFFFDPAINKAFAAEQGCIPNTADALLQFDVPAGRTSTVGQATFSYPFYKTVTKLMGDGFKNSYTATNEKYITANPSLTYYHLEGTNYIVADASYREANPDATIYRKEEDMVGISKMNAPSYMDKNYIAVDSAYIAAHSAEKLYYLNGASYAEANADYIAANPSETLYRLEYSLKFTLEDYMDRLEIEFIKAKQSR